MSDRKSIGKTGELYAQNFLKKLGYTIIASNYFTPFGELDIIAVKDNTLIFVEVKTRSSKMFGTPADAVTAKKLVHIQKSGEYFALNNRSLPKKQRIDVVSLMYFNNQITEAELIQVY